MDLTENSPMKRCKRDGENMNSQGVVNADTISDLPDALIHHILCLIPVKEAVATSVLSKQWRYLWKMMPNLKFECTRHNLQLGDICKSFLSHKAPVVESFQLRVHLDGRNNNSVDTENLIGVALNRNVSKLSLEVHFAEGFKIPTSLYNCETLETLKLWIWVTMDVPSTVCLKSLTSLSLLNVDFKDDESVINFLSGCPNLQNLKVQRDSSSNLKTFIIAVPSLQRLTILNNYCGKQHYVINAPSLKYLKIDGFRALESCLIENVPELVEAKVINVNKLIDEKFLGSFTSVKHLTLAFSPLEMKFPTGSIFNQLVYLELHTHIEAWWNLLTPMLDGSPKLQVLKLIDPGKIIYINNNLVARAKWNQPKNVPECLLLHLETFTWKGYYWQQKEERQVAKYILKNSNHLKRATFSSSEHICSKDRLVVVNDLKSVVKDTNSCDFQFELDTYICIFCQT